MADMRMTFAAICLAAAPFAGLADELPSWRDGEAKAAITGFVEAVTDAAGPDFVPVPERIAVFDNDGTLWLEQPVYTQLVYALDRVRALAAERPEWAEDEIMRAAAEGDLATVAAGGEAALARIVMASHAGMTTDEFNDAVADWLASARHPRFERPYTELVYQPMLELLDYLRAHDFQTFIVTGGGIDFVRVFAEAVYGIPPEQVVGSSIKVAYEVRDDGPAIVKLPELDFIDDKAGKPVAIHKFIGRRPILAFGNSDGDFEMLEWTTAGDGPRLGLLVHHDDAEREYAYDRDSHIGRLDRGLDEAEARGWVVVSMQHDWHKVFPE
jgi:phosphoglycolate phosphatase-like HAD superfamily hydrolase